MPVGPGCTVVVQFKLKFEVDPNTHTNRWLSKPEVIYITISHGTTMFEFQQVVYWQSLHNDRPDQSMGRMPLCLVKYSIPEIEHNLLTITWQLPT